MIGRPGRRRGGSMIGPGSGPGAGGRMIGRSGLRPGGTMPGRRSGPGAGGRMIGRSGLRPGGTMPGCPSGRRPGGTMMGCPSVRAGGATRSEGRSVRAGGATRPEGRSVRAGGATRPERQSCLRATGTECNPPLRAPAAFTIPSRAALSAARSATASRQRLRSSMHGRVRLPTKPRSATSSGRCAIDIVFPRNDVSPRKWTGVVCAQSELRAIVQEGLRNLDTTVVMLLADAGSDH